MEGHPITELLSDTGSRASDDDLRARNLFFAEVEHKVKTAMAVVQGWAITLDDRWDQMDDVGRREGVALIRRTADRLVKQCEELLDEARLGVLLEEMKREHVDLVEIVTNVGESSGVRGHAIVCDLDGPVFAEAVPSAVHQIISHLVDNAEKYSPADAPVVVRARNVGSSVVVDVIDRGSGVPEGDEADSIFDPFTRASDPTVGGAGLGLFIVRRLAEAMGGSVSAARNPVSGSTFTVVLPSAEVISL